jgi:thymidine kinase
MLTAICVVCGDTATRTQRLVGGRPAAIDDPLVVIGGFDTAAAETYEARCHRHHEIGAARSPDDRLPDTVEGRAAANG